jgi:hypothetical protein
MTEIVIGALVLIVALAFFAFMDSSGQPEKKDEGPQILDEDDFDE